MMFGVHIRRVPLAFTPVIRRKTSIATNFESDKADGVTPATTKLSQCGIPTERTIRDKHLANITVTSFYSQTAIEQAAAKVIP